MMWLTTMNPDTRRLIKVTPSDAQLTSEMFDLLLGERSFRGRKGLYIAVLNEYISLADIS